MRVYLVYAGDDNEQYVDAIFSSREKACAYLRTKIYPQKIARWKATLALSDENARREAESRINNDDIRVMVIDPI